MRITIAILTLIAVGWLVWEFIGEPDPPPEIPVEESGPDAATPHPRVAESPGTAEPTSSPAPKLRTTAPTDGGPGVFGTVTQLGRAAPNRIIRVRGTRRNETEFVAQTTTDAEGRYFVATGPGQMHVRLHGSEAKPHPSHTAQTPLVSLSQIPVAHAYAEVHDAPVRRDFVAPGGRVEVRVRDAERGTPIAGASVRSTISRGWMVWAQQTDSSGRCVFSDVALARFEFEATAALFLSSGDRVGHPTETTPTVFLDLLLQPESAIVVSLVDEGGKRVPISAALRLSVHRNGDPGPVTQTSRHGFRGKDRPTEITYGQLRPGPYRIALDDERVPDGTTTALRYQPVDAIHEVQVEALPRERVNAELRVRYRCYAQLRGRNHNGSVAHGSRVRIQRLDGDTRRILPAPWQRREMHRDLHFDGYLAPGSYVVRFHGPDGQQWQERLDVTREPITRDFDLPW